MTFPYSITLTSDEYRSAKVMSDRGYLGCLIDHATREDWNDDESAVTLLYSESAARTLVQDVLDSLGDVWALTNPSTSLGAKFVAFFERII